MTHCSEYTPVLGIDLSDKKFDFCLLESDVAKLYTTRANLNCLPILSLDTITWFIKNETARNLDPPNMDANLHQCHYDWGKESRCHQHHRLCPSLINEEKN